MAIYGWTWKVAEMLVGLKADTDVRKYRSQIVFNVARNYYYSYIVTLVVAAKPNI